MPGLFHFLWCVGKAVVKNGGKALCSLIPFGEVVFEVARDAYEDYCKDHTEADLRADLERLAQAGQAELRHATEAAAAQVAAGQPAEIRLTLVSYLTQLPASIRQSLRRPSDPGGTTVPPGLSLRKPEDLLPFLPAALPRFKPGDRPLAADWELVELLGKGGFGEVWKARHLTRSRQRPVALKFCLDPVAAATLRNEAALHNHLDRVQEEASAPGIVPLLETYLRADPPCLMYEFIEGGDLAGLVHEMQAQDRLTPEFATRIIHRLASIVAVAHRLDPPLVHRDLKLSNVLVRQREGDLPDLFVADFGIGGLAAGQALRAQAGRRVLSSQLLPTAIRGAYTPLYASPQQVKGERPDPRDDVHALGVIWYQLVTGDLRLLSIPPDWQDVVEERGLGEGCIRLLAACIASRAEKRPVDAATLAERLAGCLPDETVGAMQAETIQPNQQPSTTPRLHALRQRFGKLSLAASQHLQSLQSQEESASRHPYDLDPEPAYRAATRLLELHLRSKELALLDEGKETGYLTYRHVSDYLSARIFRIEPDGPVKVLPDDAVNREKLDQLLVVLNEQGIDLIDDTDAVPLDPDDALVHYNSGKAWFDKEEYGRAIEEFDEAMRLDPEDAVTYHFLRGIALLAESDHFKAIADYYDEAIRLDPEGASAYYFRGLNWDYEKEYDKAIGDYSEAIRLDPKDELAYGRLAWLLATCPEEKVRDGKRAIQMGTKACELTYWKSDWELNTLAAAYAEAGQFDDAERYQTKALEYPVHRGPARNRLELYKQKKPFRQST